MDNIPLLWIFAALTLAAILLAVLYHRSRIRDTVGANASLKREIGELKRVNANLQRVVREIDQKERYLSRTFSFLPDLISKLTSHREKREIFDNAMNWLDQMVAPSKGFIFLERDGTWVSAVKRDPDNPLGEHRCGRNEGILGVAADLKVTIDSDDLGLLSVEKQQAILNDPLQRLGIQVCSPMVYENEVHGIIALCGVPNYAKRQKILVNMVSDLTASSLVSSTLFKQFKYMANRDSLTGLVNRRGFEQAILRSVLDASRNRRPFSVAIFDIDHFKNYNDTNGHNTGDEALKITARLLEESFRSGDVRARYGGEEFVVLLNNTEKEQAFALADKFRATVEQFSYPVAQSQPGGRVSVSGGVATFPADGDSVLEIVQRADEALYLAKEGGRNRVMRARAGDFSEGESSV